MKIVVVLFLVVCGVSFGQSKKEINALLLVELSKVRSTYDSYKTTYLTKFEEVEDGRKNVRNRLRSFSMKSSELSDLKMSIGRTHTTLTTLGFDANSIVRMENVSSVHAPSPSLIYERHKGAFDEVFYFTQVKDTLQLDGLKRKVQNQRMAAMIEIYKSANELNMVVLKKQIVSVVALKQTIPLEIDSMFTNLAEKKSSLVEIDQSLKSKYEELKENYRSKGPKGFSEAYQREFPEIHPPKPKKGAITPPVVIDRDYEDSEGWVTQDPRGADFAPPPDPVVKESPSQKSEMPVIYDIVEVEAQFPGGMVAMKEYFRKNLKYPETAEEMGLTGKCYLKFVVSESGNISNVKVVRGVSDCPECDKEAIRVIKAMPDWIPAKNNGNAVNSYFNIPVKFPYE